jgi:hypothetical protein
MSTRTLRGMEDTDMAGWRRYEALEHDRIDADEIDAVINTVDAANWEEDFDLGEPWGEETDPAEDDPE